MCMAEATPGLVVRSIGVNEHGASSGKYLGQERLSLDNSEVRGNQMRNRLNALYCSQASAVHLVLILVASLFFDTVRACVCNSSDIDGKG